MKLNKQLFILGPALLLTGVVEGAAKLTLEPIYGVETRLVRYPEPAHYRTGATYGARVLYGVSIFSGEAEYTTTQSREDHDSRDMKIDDKSERLSLGFRSTFPMNPYIGPYIRLGGRASQGQTKITVGSDSETKDNPLRIDPYAGAGVQIAFHQYFALNAGVTMIRNSENKYDSQYTLGLSARFGNR